MFQLAWFYRFLFSSSKACVHVWRSLEKGEFVSDLVLISSFSYLFTRGFITSTGFGLPGASFITVLVLLFAAIFVVRGQGSGS